jgi:hypothetical protein
MHPALPADVLTMEKRREPRFVADQIISVTCLGEKAVTVAARVQNYSGRGLGVHLPDWIEPGTAIQIHVDDAILLGEAIYVRREADVVYAGIELDQTLCGLSELARVLSAFESSSGAQAADSTGQRRQQD